MFYGSSMWHLRRSSANAALLYLKCNDFDADPLGEDPETPVRRARTVDAAGSPGAAELDDLVPVLARRLQSVMTEYGRDWVAHHSVVMFGDRPVGISGDELELLRRLDGVRTSGELVEASDATRDALLRLAVLGAVDLVEDGHGSRAITASPIADVDAAPPPPADGTRS